MYTEILSNHNLTVTQWEKDLYEEYIGQLMWKHYMGTSEDAIIQVKEELMRLKGDKIRFGIAGKVIGGHVTGNAKVIGNEGRMEFYDDEITVDNDRQSVKFEDVPMSNQRAMFDVLMKGKAGLKIKAREALDDGITVALSNTSEGRVQGRYLYGSADSNWNATHASALAAIDNSADKLSVRMLSIAKRKGQIPLNGATTKMRPMRVKVGKDYEEWFCFKGHSFAIRDMVDDDAAWKNAQLNIPPGSRDDSPLFKGSTFKGAWNGVLIYEYDRLLLEASTMQVAHNLLLGAQACGLAWAQRSKFGEEEADVGHDVTYELHEIRGIKKLVFSRASEHDHGVVHVFSAAQAD
jgi:N4-gp56 family major capsid protein